MSEQVSVSQDIGAPADTVWRMVSDVTRMGEWSPEAVGAVWLRGDSGPVPGARFRGRNRNGKKKWETVGVVTEAESGRVFAFRVSAAGFRVAEWRYEFEPKPAGCRVTETWTDQRGRVAKVLGKPVSGVVDRAAHNRSTMQQTLTRLAAAAERDNN